jgi:hypothetical protein
MVFRMPKRGAKKLSKLRRRPWPSEKRKAIAAVVYRLTAPAPVLALAPPGDVRIWVPGPVMAPNTLWVKDRYARAAIVKLSRTKAQIFARASRQVPIPAPAAVTFIMVRHRLLDENSVAYAMKSLQDGITDILLPNGDGPSSGYAFYYHQVKGQKAEEGVLVIISSREPLVKSPVPRISLSVAHKS